MNELNSIHRCSSLVPLSNEHRDGLQFVERVREGLKNRINMERLRKYVSWYWKHHIRPHFFQEEKILLPFLSPGHAMVDQLLSEHNFIRELMIAIDQDTDREDVNILCRYLVSHIKWEEEFLFPYLERELSESNLASISERLNLHPVNNNEMYSDLFWNTTC